MADDDKRAFQVVLIGGYGFFGQRLANRLARMRGLHLILAGRDRGKADATVERLRHEGAAATLEAAAIDIDATDFMERLAALAPHAVVHTGGPFQGQDYRVAETCIAIGAHYVDLADGRRFVCDIIRLDARAREAGVLVVSGASSVPALSGAAVTRLTLDMNEVESIAVDGDGPFVPTLAAAALIRALHTGRIGARGAMPCFELLELDDILAEASGLAITTLPPC